MKIPLTLALPKGRGDVMVRQAHRDNAVALSLSKGLSPPLTGGDEGEGAGFWLKTEEK